MTLDSLPVHAESLPSRSSAPPAEVVAQDDLGDFGELDLPPGPLSGPPPKGSLPPNRISKVPEMNVGRAGDFGDLFGPSDPAAPNSAKEAEFSDPFGDALASVTNDPSMHPPAQKASGGGMGFGEVDLGDAPAGGAEIISTIPEEAPLPSAPPPPVSAPIIQGGGGPVLPTEIAIGSAPTRSRRGADEDEKRGRGRFVAIGAFVLVVGGALLELTPYGAFGRYPISDAVHASDYQRATMSTAAAARTQLLTDIYSDSKSAVDAVDNAHKGSPRARSLTAYLAVSEFEHQLRFGVDPDRTARARVALAEIPPGIVVPYASVATALQDALGDLTHGRASLDAASKRDPGDPIQEDIAYARGALELRARDGKAAQAAFQKALGMRPSDAAKMRAHITASRAVCIWTATWRARKKKSISRRRHHRSTLAHAI